MLTVGEKVVYPSQGPCLICAIVEKLVNGRTMAFYQLLVLDKGAGKLFVPVDKAGSVGIRPLLKRTEIPKVLCRLSNPAQSNEDYRQRARDNVKLLASVSAYDLADVVESLSAIGHAKSLSFSDRKMLDRAKGLLVSEISEVMKESKEEAEERVDQALKAREDGAKPQKNAADARSEEGFGKEMAAERYRKTQRAAV